MEFILDLDFQDYAKPSRLFPTTEIKFFSGHSEEEKMMFDDVGNSQSLYKIKLHTSRMYGSGLTDANAGILLCLIDEHGHSLLQRLCATPMTEFSVEWQEKVDHDILHFQRASVDELTFKGPKLGRLQALWISLESGLPTLELLYIDERPIYSYMCIYIDIPLVIILAAVSTSENYHRSTVIYASKSGQFRFEWLLSVSTFH